MDFPGKLTSDPSEQLLAYSRGQGVSENDASNWLTNPKLLNPWQTAQVYFYYAGIADGVKRYGRLPAGLIGFQYWFFYPYNYYPTVVKRNLMLPQPLAGDRSNTDLHEGDWEHITVLADADPPYRPRFLYLARHDVEGDLYRWTDSRLSFDGTHPIVQAAFGGHPSYDSVCGERKRRLLHNQSSDWVICATGRYGFRA